MCVGSAAREREHPSSTNYKDYKEARENVVLKLYVVY